MKTIIENKNFKEKDFSKYDFSNQSYLDSFFENCDFSNSNFSNAKFINCRFFRSNFSLVILSRTRLQNCFFEESKLIGIHFFKCDKFLLSINFKKCLIDICNFSDIDLKKSSFFESTLRRCDFKNSILIETDFRKTDLSSTSFHHSNLSKANFLDAINYSIDPLTNKLEKAEFSKPEVYSLLNFLDIIIE